MSKNKNTNDDLRYDELADRAERGELRGLPGTQRHGEDAAADARAAIFAATGTSTIEDAARVALGRPRLGEDNRPETTTWRVRTPAPLDDRARQAAAAQGMSLSEYVRLAVAHQLDTDAVSA